MPYDVMSAIACIFKIFIYKSLEVYIWTIWVFYAGILRGRGLNQYENFLPLSITIYKIQLYQ
jgi:hypothetical protein